MDFVTAKARAATHPIFGNVVNEYKGKQFLDKQRRKRSNNANGFSTQGKGQHSETAHENPKCPLCCANHWLSRCDKFRKQSLEERQKFIQDKKLCSNCLSPGHFVRTCQKDSFCKVKGCSSKHSTFLHPGRSKTSLHVPAENSANSNAIQVAALATTDPQPDSSPTSANNGYIKSSFSSSSTVTGLAIVPVCVKVKGRQEVAETYAFLDSGSNTSFCTESILEKLNSAGRKTTLSLTTLEGEKISSVCSLVSLEGSDLNQENVVDLPVVYSRPSLPIPSEAIARQEDVDRWPHLKGINVQQIDAEIGLLIGSDVPQALQPMEFKASKNGGQVATRTTLGWVINGPLGRSTLKSPTANFVQANKTLEQLFQEYCNLEFNYKMYDSKISMSQNDRRALDIMEQTVKLENSHYEIALPWKKYPPSLQNNRAVAERRLSLLKKRLKREPMAHEK